MAFKVLDEGGRVRGFYMTRTEYESLSERFGRGGSISTINGVRVYISDIPVSARDCHRLRTERLAAGLFSLFRR